MNFYEYEADVYEDSLLPIYYSSSCLENERSGFPLHWHEATELLYCQEGNGIAVSDTLHIPLRAGELAVINPNRLHTIYAPDSCRYSYFLVSSELISAHNMPKEGINPFVSDRKVSGLIQEIIREIEGQPPFYRTEVCAKVISLFVYLHRNFPEQDCAAEQGRSGRQMEMVKSVISYIRRHFTEPITVDDICNAVSYSRSQVCHVFKEVTGKSLVEYINYVRCNHARVLLNSQQYTVSECAQQSGFHTLSYFSRIYRKQMGVPPSIHR